jgi:histone H3/H4
VYDEARTALREFLQEVTMRAVTVAEGRGSFTGSPKTVTLGDMLLALKVVGRDLYT